MANKPRIVVRGSYNKAPLLDTEEAMQVEFYDCNNELVALVGHIASDDLWFYSDKSNADWVQVLARTGFMNNMQGVTLTPG